MLFPTFSLSKPGVGLLIRCLVVATAMTALSSAHAGDSTNVTPGDGPQCALIAPATVSFNTVMQPSLTIPLRSNCTRYPVKWEWTAPPLDYTSRNLSGANAIFAPLFANQSMSWSYDNRKVTNTNTINLTFTTTGTYTFATRAKDADYIPPNNQPAGFWGPWGKPGATSIDTSDAWRTITLTCQPQSETRSLGVGGNALCTGGQVSSTTETRTFCADSATPTWGAWTPSTSCACPSGTAWNGSVCVPVPTCTVAATPPIQVPGQPVQWNATCDTPPSVVTWVVTSTPPATVCTAGLSCAQTYPDPRTVCYSVRGSNVSGQGPASTPSCVTVACPAPSVWSAGARACGLPPTITSPVFPVGQPQPPTVSVTITGTPPVTCSGNSLPIGWTMSAACALTTSTPGIPMPVVPASCTVTATNAWGTDTKPCIAQNEPVLSCETRWEQTPLVLGTSNYISPKSQDFLEGLNAASPTSIVLDSEDKILSSIKGQAKLLISTTSADSYTVACDGAPVFSEQGPIETSTGASSALVEYEKKYAFSPSSYRGYFKVNEQTHSRVDSRSDTAWISYTDTLGNDTGYRAYTPVNYAITTSQAASDPPASPVCTVTVRKAATGQTATCASAANRIVDSSRNSYCTLNVSMLELLYNYYDSNGRAQSSSGVYPAGVPTTSVTSSTLTPTLSALRSPNRAFLRGALFATGIELGGSYAPPSTTPTPTVAPFQNSDVTCRKRAITLATPNPTWNNFTVPFVQTYTSGASLNPVQRAISSASTMGNGAYLGPGYGGNGSIYAPPTSYNEVIDSQNSQYELECSYTGQGFNGGTGARESVSCSAWYTYTPGAVCAPDVAIAQGPTGTLFAGGSAIYTGYLAGWKGTVKYLGDRLKLTGTDGIDRVDVGFPSTWADRPTLQSFVWGPRQKDRQRLPGFS